jgi:hypothetical protein
MHARGLRNYFTLQQRSGAFGLMGALAVFAALFGSNSARVVGATATQSAGTWANVTPSNVNLTNNLDCGNFGTQTVVVDPDRPSNLYAQFNCQGIWKSTDYGQTWNGNIATGTNALAATDCAGGIAIGSGGGGTNPPILYESCIRGSYVGFLSSTDGGVDWTEYNIAPAGSRQDVYPPTVDPYNPAHLILDAHEANAIYQSFDGGHSWSGVNMQNGMSSNGGTAFTFFINTGSATTTASTLLYIAQGNGGSVGTWRTTNAGSTWKQVSTNEHPHGNSQIYQPDSSGVVYMAGIYATGGWGVLRSPDYGATWSNVVSGPAEAVAYGTPNNVYSEYGWACGIGCLVAPSLALAPQPGVSGWSRPTTPAAMSQGPATAAVTFDGTYYEVITANWLSGLWRYIEPSSGVAPTPTPTAVAVPSTTPTSGPGSRPRHGPQH